MGDYDFYCTDTGTGIVSQTATVTVVLPVTSIALDKTQLALVTNGTSTAKLTANVSPDDATVKHITWTSDDETVATVDQQGNVMAVGDGSCTVTATAKDGSGKSGSCKIAVSTSVTSVALDRSELALVTNGTATTARLEATVSPDNATDKALEWASSDVKVATVDQEGNVAAVGDGSCTISATAKDGSGKSASVTVTVTTAVAPAKIARLWGNEALDTMTGITRTGWTEGSCDTVIVATMDGYWDALSASALAGLSSNRCPVLITSGTSLSSQTAGEIRRLGAKKVYIAGGPVAVGQGVEDSIKALGVVTERLAGDDAVGTSLDIYEEGVGSWGTTCIIATNNGYWDALAASPYAYAQGAPIFLYNAASGRLDDQVLQAIEGGGFSHVIVCGGEVAVPSLVEDQLAGVGFGADAIDRRGGAMAVETSALIAQACLDANMTADGVAVATDGGYWDALTGAALCGKNNAPLVLANDGNRSAITGFIAAHKSEISKAYVFGGVMAVSEGTKASLVNVLQ